jgi:hypothetical protein
MQAFAKKRVNMNRIILPALVILLTAQSPAYAINDKYRKQLEPQTGAGND